MHLTIFTNEEALFTRVVLMVAQQPCVLGQRGAKGARGKSILFTRLHLDDDGEVVELDLVVAGMQLNDAVSIGFLLRVGREDSDAAR